MDDWFRLKALPSTVGSFVELSLTANNLEERHISISWHVTLPYHLDLIPLQKPLDGLSNIRGDGEVILGTWKVLLNAPQIGAEQEVVATAWATRSSGTVRMLDKQFMSHMLKEVPASQARSGD